MVRHAASSKSLFGIRVVQNRTGIPADTLRIWERRYGFPNPMRNANGIRAYSEHDVERLLLIAKAIRAGFRAGDIVPKRMADLEEMLLAVSQTERTPPFGERDPIEEMLNRLLADDGQAFAALLRKSAAFQEASMFIKQVAAPLTHRVGELWADKVISIHQEHLFSATLTTQLRVLLSALNTQGGRPVVALSTLPGEHHMLGLEMIAVFLAANQASPRLLGASMPIEELVRAVAATNADVLGLSFSAAYDATNARKYVAKLLEELPRKVQVWGGGSLSSTLRDLPGYFDLSSFETLEQHLHKMKSRWGGP